MDIEHKFKVEFYSILKRKIIIQLNELNFLIKYQTNIEIFCVYIMVSF